MSGHHPARWNICTVGLQRQYLAPSSVLVIVHHLAASFWHPSLFCTAGRAYQFCMDRHYNACVATSTVRQFITHLLPLLYCIVLSYSDAPELYDVRILFASCRIQLIKLDSRLCIHIKSPEASSCTPDWLAHNDSMQCRRINKETIYTHTSIIYTKQGSGIDLTPGRRITCM